VVVEGRFMSATQLPTFGGILPNAPPADAYAVRGIEDGLYYGWGKTLEQTVSIACSVALRSTLEVEVVDPSGERQALIAQFEMPSTEVTPLSLITQGDPDDPMTIRVQTNKDGVSIDWGDGTASRLSEQSGSHTYATADAFHLVATLGTEQTEAWATTQLPPTVDLEPGESGATKEGT
jgi:hypothetical protein